MENNPFVPTAQGLGDFFGIRIAAGGFEHETNTFSNILVTEETVKAIQMEGATLIQSWRGVRNTMVGLLDECEALGIELVPMPRVDIMPCGVTEKAVYEMFRDYFVEELWKAHCQKPLDAIALNIHCADLTTFDYKHLNTDCFPFAERDDMEHGRKSSWKK